jgi:hypothetical protein
LGQAVNNPQKQNPPAKKPKVVSKPAVTGNSSYNPTPKPATPKRKRTSKLDFSAF